IGGALALPHPAHAATDDGALKAAEQTRLAYVETGDADTDAISRAGLTGLSNVLRNRTSFEPADPVGVDVSRDEISFFPLLYWPMSDSQADLSPDALTRINTYLKNGGM